ncbi:GIY-YIG nuclease family protein [Halosimplex marinum]|uniref:GIY-YIG nuclease family protein n=1 Tax=Halosimplex marinum TaxID=3396620 RepID=UPI003F548594
MSAVGPTERWQWWATRYILNDIRSAMSPHPIPLYSVDGEAPETTSRELDRFTSEFPSDSAYLYVLYTDDHPSGTAWTPSRLRPVYVGETTDIAGRLATHVDKLRGPNPNHDSDRWGKYNHLATVRDRADSRLYVWARPVTAIERGPYGHDCAAKELEAKLVGLLHRIPPLRRTLANREHVPHWSRYARNNDRIVWVQFDPLADHFDQSPTQETAPTTERSKAALWQDWIEQYLVADLTADTAPDPIPLFDTAPDGETVHVTADEVLARSPQIEQRIRTVATQCLDGGTPIGRDREGLLYLMYQIQEGAEPSDPAAIDPLYLGKAEMWGKQKDLSTNFDEFRPNHTGTRMFARWGDGPDWHIGQLSAAVRTGEEGHVHWADALFEPESRRLRDPTYLWVHVWDRDDDVGPYGDSVSLPVVEAQLIALAYDVAPTTLLNKDGVPAMAPIKQAESHFDSPAEWPRGGSRQQNLDDFR